jgi:3',5'-cyclic AMP phosphodiesterase CpdA
MADPSARRPPPALYGLFWAATIPGDTTPPFMELRPRANLILPVALQIGTRVDVAPPVDAIILYPALLTPALCTEGTGAAFELLLLASATSGINAALVNRHLKIGPELSPSKWATQAPLFPNPTGLIDVKQVAGGIGDEWDKVLDTHAAFRGIVDQRFWDSLRAWEKARRQQEGDDAKRERRPARAFPALDTVYRVKVDLACLTRGSPTVAGPIGPSEATVRRIRADTGKLPPGVWSVREAQDGLVHDVLMRRNGDALKGRKGKGNCCFPVIEENKELRLELSRVDVDQPIRAYHPLFVYPAGALEYASMGHVSDLHLNARQHLLAQTPAQVIDLEAEASCRVEAPPSVSPRIGGLVNVCSDSLLSILQRLDAQQADVVLVGGDLIDHVKNAYPFTEHHEGEALDRPSAAKVWELVGLGDSAARKKNYQACVDYLGFYSLARHLCVTRKKPIFVVSGNHDAYLEPFGISPRLPWQDTKVSTTTKVLGAVLPPVGLYAVARANIEPKKANPGIPADHNLTFYEAILAFGESYGDVKPLQALSLHTELFEWFYGILTPFRDYAVDLPKQRLVGLAWGDDEGKMIPSGHGLGHLPRATEAVGAEQLALVEKATGGDKQVVLFTHFTFVSYEETIANVAGGRAVREGRVKVTEGQGYTMQDLGTFEHGRGVLYGAVAAGAGKIACVLTGHSHRKGLYFLAKRDRRDRTHTRTMHGEQIDVVEADDGYATEMHPLRKAYDASSPALATNQGKAAIVVSDSAGPLPRLNDHGELLEWGSDRPAGTLVRFSKAGVVGIEPVQAELGRAVPRLAVAIDFLQVMNKGVFKAIRTREYDLSAPFNEKNHGLVFDLADAFPGQAVRLARAVLFHQETVGGPWSWIHLAPPTERRQETIEQRTMDVQPRDNPKFQAWLKVSKCPRFLSLAFEPVDPDVKTGYDWGAGGIWNLEVTCKMRGLVSIHWDVEPSYEVPDFDLRREFFPKVYT